VNQYLQNQEITINQVVPSSKFALKILRLSPMRANVSIAFKIQDFEGRVLATSTKTKNLVDSLKIIENKFKSYPSMENLFQYELQIEEDDVLLENDVNFKFTLNGSIHFNIPFNLGFLQKYNVGEFPQLSNLRDINVSMKDHGNGNAHMKLISELDFPVYFQEFGIKEIDKLCKHPKDQAKLTETFSVFVGFKLIL